MKLFNFEKKTSEPKKRITSYDNYGGEFIESSGVESKQFYPECILESKEQLPKFLYRGVKQKGPIYNIDTALNSLKEINPNEDSIVNWQTESLSTTEDRNVAFSYALEGELANKLDIIYKDGSVVFQFLRQEMGRWLLDHYPERFVDISEEGEVSINWEKAKTEALKLLDEQIKVARTNLNNDKNIIEYNRNKYLEMGDEEGINNDSYVNIVKQNINDIEASLSEESIKKYKESISRMNSENVIFKVGDEIKDITLGYLFELKPKDQVRVATRKSVDDFMKHHNIYTVISSGTAKTGSPKEKLTNLMRDAGYHGIDKESEEKEIGFFNPEDLKPVFGLEIKIINGKLVAEKHILDK